MQAKEQVKIKLEEFLRREDLQLISLRINEHAATCQINIVIDKKHGVSMDDCAKVNKFIAGYIGEENLFEGNFWIDVSSAGLDRPLKSEVDFYNSLGKQIKVVTRLPIAKQQVFYGRLKEAANRKIVIETDDKMEVTLNLDDIKKAKLEIRWK